MTKIFFIIIIIGGEKYKMTFTTIINFNTKCWR